MTIFKLVVFGGSMLVQYIVLRLEMEALFYFYILWFISVLLLRLINIEAFT